MFPNIRDMSEATAALLVLLLQLRKNDAYLSCMTRAGAQLWPP